MESSIFVWLSVYVMQNAPLRHAEFISASVGWVCVQHLCGFKVRMTWREYKDDKIEVTKRGNAKINMNQYYVYIMTNYSRRSLYIGMTNDLVMRVAEHKAYVNGGFTAKYDCKVLLYYEEFPSAGQAIAREKQLKNWHREWKINLIKEQNPDLADLSETIGVTVDIVEGIRYEYTTRGCR